MTEKENRRVYSRKNLVGKIAVYHGEFGWSTEWQEESGAPMTYGFTEVASAASAICYLLGALEDGGRFKMKDRK